MRPRKICAQIAVCLLVLTAAAYGRVSTDPRIVDVCEQVHTVLMTELDGETLRSMGKELRETVVGMPSRFVSAVSRVNSDSRYGAPIDQKSDSAVRQVHAAAGGVVTASGKRDDIGLYVEIRHEAAVTVYGQLSDLRVVERERVQRGEIIGSYDADCGAEFYYELREDL